MACPRPFNDTDFHLDDDARKALALPAIGVTVAGGLVFAHLHTDADTTMPAGWMAGGDSERTLPDGSIITPGPTIRHRASERREGGC